MAQSFEKTIEETEDRIKGKTEKSLAQKETGETVYEASAVNLVSALDPSCSKGDLLLDTYRIDSEPIYGGMGSVWKVHHKGWDVDLAMKRPQAKLFQSEAQKENFINECKTWIDLGLHPNIVSCYYVREIDGVPTIFSEWMENGSLENRIQDGSLYKGTEKEQQERLLDIAIQFARGLHYAHEQGRIHQDVKPDNLLLTKDWDAKVADFGLAKARAQLTVLEGANTELDAGATVMAPSGGYTPAYCSMEQMDGKPLTRRTDIYSWAVSVMEMYIGGRPWANGVVAGLNCRKYLNDTRVPMSEALKELMVKCLSAEQNDRPHDFAEIEAELKEIYKTEADRDYPRPESVAAPDTAESLNNQAMSYLDMGMTDMAEKLWKSALKNNPGNMLLLYNLSLHLWRKAACSDSEMEQMLNGAVNNMTDRAEACRMMLMFEAERGDRAGAEQWLEKAKTVGLIPDMTLQNAIDQILCEDRFTPFSTDKIPQNIIQDELNHMHFSCEDYGGSVQTVLIFEGPEHRLRHSYKVPGYREHGGAAMMHGVGSGFNGGSISVCKNRTIILEEYDIHSDNHCKPYAEWHYIVPNYKASFVLARIQSYRNQTENAKRFRALIKEANACLGFSDAHGCKEILSIAEQIPGYSNDSRILELEYSCGKYLKKSGIRAIHEISFPKSATADTKVLYHPIIYHGIFETGYSDTSFEEMCASIWNPVQKLTATARLDYLKKDEGIKGEFCCGSIKGNDYEDGIFDLAFSPCGSYLLVVAVHVAELWNISEEKCFWSEPIRPDYRVGPHGNFADNGRYLLINDRAWELRYFYE